MSEKLSTASEEILLSPLDRVLQVWPLALPSWVLLQLEQRNNDVLAVNAYLSTIDYPKSSAVKGNNEELNQQQKNAIRFEKAPTWEEQKVSIERNTITKEEPLWSSKNFSTFLSTKPEFNGNAIEYQRILASIPIPPPSPPSPPREGQVEAFLAPVKSELYRVTKRHQLRTLFPNTFLHKLPPPPPPPVKVISPRSKALNACYGSIISSRKALTRSCQTKKIRKKRKGGRLDERNKQSCLQRRMIPASSLSSSKESKINDLPKIWPYHIPLCAFYHDNARQSPSRTFDEINLLRWSDIIDDEIFINVMKMTEEEVFIKTDTRKYMKRSSYRTTHSLSYHMQQRCSALTLGGSRRLTSDGLLQSFNKNIKFVNIAEITLSSCYAINDDVLRSIGLSLSSKTLKTIKLIKLNNITDYGIQSVAIQHGSTVQYWSIKNCHRITTLGLKFLGDKCAAMNSLEIEECDNNDGSGPPLSDGISYILDRCYVLNIVLINVQSMMESVLFDLKSKMNHLTQSIHFIKCPVNRQHLSRLFQLRKCIITTKNGTTKHVLQQPLFNHIYFTNCQQLKDLDVTPMYENSSNSTTEHRRPTRSLICSELTTLNVSNTLLSDTSMISILNKSSKLRELNCNHMKNITINTLLLVLRTNPWIKILKFMNCEKCLVTNQFCKFLMASECRNVLTTLWLHGIQRGHLSEEELPRKKVGKKVGKKVILPLPQSVFLHLPFLKHFKLCSCEYLNDCTVMNLVNGCSHTLETITLKTKCYQLTSKSIHHIFFKCAKLIQFDLGHATGVSFEKIKIQDRNHSNLTQAATRTMMAPLPKTVTSVSFTGCTQLNDTGLVHLLSNCARNLTTLDVSKTSITESSLYYIFQHCKTLINVSSKYCQKINFHKFYNLSHSIHYTLANANFSGCDTSKMKDLASFISTYVPLGSIEKASSQLFGHGLGKHGIRKNDQLTKDNVHSRLIYIQSILHRNYSIETIQKITRRYIARCYYLKRKKHVKNMLARSIQLCWNNYLKRKALKKNNREQGLKKLNTLFTLKICQHAFCAWCQQTINNRHYVSSIRIQTCWRRYECYHAYDIWKKQVKRSTYLKFQWRTICLSFIEKRRKREGKKFQIMRKVAIKRTECWRHSHLKHGYTKWIICTINQRKQSSATIITRNIKLFVYRLIARNVLKNLKIENTKKIQKELMKKINRMITARIQGTLKTILFQWHHLVLHHFLKLRKSMYLWLKYVVSIKNARYGKRLRCVRVIQRFFMLLLYKKKLIELQIFSSMQIQRMYRGTLGRHKAYIQNERVRVSILYSRCMWFDIRRDVLSDLPRRKNELIKRDNVKRSACKRIQKEYRHHLGSRYQHCLIMYKKHSAANIIQNFIRRYLAVIIIKNRKKILYYHANKIQKFYKWYRRKCLWQGINRELYSRREKKRKFKKNEALQESMRKEHERKLTVIMYNNATIINTRLRYYWALKKNWKKMKEEEELLKIEEEEKKQAIRDMEAGNRKFHNTNMKKIKKKDEWKEELATYKIPQKIKHLEKHINKRKFGIIHRTFGWMRYKAYSFRTSVDKKQKRGLPTLKPILSTLERNKLKRKQSKKKNERMNSSKSPTKLKVMIRAKNLLSYATTKVQRYTRGNVPLKLVKHAESSVKSFQRGAVRINGLVSIKFTVGDDEYNHTLTTELTNKKANRRYFEPINTDMSKSYTRATDGTRMPLQRCIMWTCIESRRAQDLVCNIDIIYVQPRDAHHKKEKIGKNGTEDNIIDGRVMEEDVQIVKHSRLPFEMHLTRGGTTPLINIVLAGKMEGKNKTSMYQPSLLLRKGYKEIGEIKSNLTKDDKAFSRKRNFIKLRSQLKCYIKTVNTNANLIYDKKTQNALNISEGIKIQNIINMAMLSNDDLSYLFQIFCEINYYEYRAKLKSCKNKTERAKLKKLQHQGDKAYKTITIDAIHLFLTEPKTIFTEFLWHIVITDCGEKRKEDLLEKLENENEILRLQEQVHSGIFTIDGDGIDSQLITFGSFCQGIVRIALFEESQILQILFRLAGPSTGMNLVSPYNLIQTFKCLHGVNGPSNQAKQNIRAFHSIYLGPGTRESRHTPSLNVNTMKSFHRYPAVTWPALRYQKSIINKFNGISWENKKRAFQEARINLITSNFQ
jgi:hypothetical protein